MSNGFLSQEEINSLLNGDSGSKKEENVSTKENSLTDIEKDMLGEIGNISMGSASTALYQILNQKVNITTPVVTVTTLEEIKESFDAPTIVLEVEYTSGITGRNVLIINVKDALVISNLMMGGDGNVEPHEISEIEISAVQEAMNQMIGSAATSMATMFSREVNISPPMSKIWKAKEVVLSDQIPENEEIVRVNFAMKIGDLVDSYIMQILPIATAKKIGAIMMGTEEEVTSVEPPKNVEVTQEPPRREVEVQMPRAAEPEYIEAKPIVERPKPQPQVEVHQAYFEPLDNSGSHSAPKNIDLILDVPLDISVVLGRTRKNIKDILSLSTGSLIELEKLAEEPVEILVNGKNIAYGEVVVVDENFGVRITSIKSNTDRIKSLK
jgi:flagellar motor switch protein FliN/FliY